MVNTANALNPRTQHYEFLGPLGAFLITVGTPAVTYALYFGCSEQAGGCPPSLGGLPARFFHAVSNGSWWRSLWDTEAALIYLAWYAFCLFAWAVMPGDWVQGTQLRNGGKVWYKMNAFSTFLLALGITAGTIFRFGAGSFTFLYEKWVGLITASLIMSIIQALGCYLGSYKDGKLLALGGNSGNPIYDFFIGRELNPSLGPLDIKSFNENRPGLILWVLLNISSACEQALRNGGRITDSMWLVLVFHGWYVTDSLHNESALLTTMDITTDGFGFMLAVGDLCWVPFVYSLQARYLAFHPVELGSICTIAIIMVNLFGYWIFRSANGEKNDFRNGNNPKNLMFMQTERGTKLLASGWWGLSRHPNYMGDWIMALAWSLPTGFETPVTYFYAAYFMVLLVHRQLRDDEQCEKKYGKDWKRYQELVPYRIFPYIY